MTDVPGGHAPPSPLRALKVLNVNDDEAARYILTRVLRGAGFEVVEAGTGGEALRLVREQPDLVVLDVNLPDLNGLEVCRRIKEEPATRKIPVLHVSATRVDSADRTLGLEGGADGYLVQPVEPGELTATVRSLLRLSRAEERARRAAEEWRAVFDAIRDAVCLLGPDAVVRQCNQGMAALVGVDAAEVAGHRFDDVMARAFPDYVGPEASAAAVAAGRRSVVEAQVGGRWYRFTDEPVVADNAAAGTVRVVSEITDAREAARRHREFVREVLAGVTDGRLRLCDGEEELPAPLGAGGGERVAVSEVNLHVLRDVLRNASRAAGLPDERATDILTAANEAAMNAVVHAGGGEAVVYAPPGGGRVQAWVRDEGTGIADEQLHRATLERGFSGRGGFGHGFWLMLATCDRLFLLTGPRGTTLVLEQGSGPAPHAWPRPESDAPGDGAGGPSLPR